MHGIDSVFSVFCSQDTEKNNSLSFLVQGSSTSAFSSPDRIPTFGLSYNLCSFPTDQLPLPRFLNYDWTLDLWPPYSFRKWTEGLFSGSCMPCAFDDVLGVYWRFPTVVSFITAAACAFQRDYMDPSWLGIVQSSPSLWCLLLLLFFYSTIGFTSWLLTLCCFIESFFLLL